MPPMRAAMALTAHVHSTLCTWIKRDSGHLPVCGGIWFGATAEQQPESEAIGATPLMFAEPWGDPRKS